MSQTYGNKLCFCAFDVQIGDCWLDVPVAEQIVTSLGLEFVPYKRINTDIDSLNAAKDEDSEIAIRRGMGPGKKREGVVLRPLKEMVLNNKDRVIVKHKRDEFRETVSPRVIDDPAKLKILEGAQVIAVEWTTPARLQHVGQPHLGRRAAGGHSMEKMRDIILAMQEDVKREADNEIVWSEPARKAIGSRTAQLYKTFLQSSIDNQPKLS